MICALGILKYAPGRWALWCMNANSSSRHRAKPGRRPRVRRCVSRGAYFRSSSAFSPTADMAGEKITTATSIAVEIVRKKPDQVGFAVNPRRWVVERFFAWIGRNRRLTKDFEATINSARAFLYVASVMLLVRRIARAS